jgi:type IV secretory pathway TrbL component
LLSKLEKHVFHEEETYVGWCLLWEDWVNIKIRFFLKKFDFFFLNVKFKFLSHIKIILINLKILIKNFQNFQTLPINSISAATW